MKGQNIMTQDEFEQLKQIVEKLQAINSKLDEIIQKMDSIPTKKNKPQTESDELKGRGLVNGLLHICTQAGFDDKQYCNALHQLKELEFPLSSKQVTWILFYGLMRHSTEGEATDQFLTNQISRRNKGQRNDFVEQVRKLAKENYKGDADYKAKLDYYLKSKLI